ncbi:MAG: 3-oxoacyl-[acyl-carrier-protein] reductase [Desulfatibacillaceae bacterium]
MSEQQRTVVVTGGSRGIGRAICVELAEPGTNIWFTWLSGADAARETTRLVEEKGAVAVSRRVDVADGEQVAALFAEIKKTDGGVDVLVNNAGIASDGFLMRMKDADWDAVMNVNLKGAFHCHREASRIMVRQRSGRIVNVTSVVADMGNVTQANYVASKAGLAGLTRAAAQELGSRNITVNAVAPGFIDTEMTDKLPEKVMETFVSRCPLGRIGKPEEIAAAVAFLASDKAAYITGHVLSVNGGLYM